MPVQYTTSVASILTREFLINTEWRPASTGEYLTLVNTSHGEIVLI
jgi:hypothetical protein